MKTVKTIFRTIVLLTIISLTSCNTDDDNGTGTLVPTARTNTFYIADYEDFSSSNVYLIIDSSGSTYQSEYKFIFTDSEIRLDANSDLSIQTSATGIIVLKGGDNATTQTSIQGVTNQITAGTQALGDNSSALNNIVTWGNLYTYNAQQYGTPEIFDLYETEPALTNALEIESITFNLAAGTGTINCSYFSEDQFGGEYSGTFEIINPN